MKGGEKKGEEEKETFACKQMLVAALFTTNEIETWKQIKCTLNDIQVKKCGKCTRGYSVKRNKISA